MNFKGCLFSALFILLCGCTPKTTYQINTVFDVGLRCINAGNHYLSEWEKLPDDYIEYKGIYVSSYHYTLKHDGTALFDAIYLRSLGEGQNLHEEHEIGRYSSSSLGPNQTIDIFLSTRKTTLTWEPNPRDPTGNLVGRIHENRTMSFLSASGDDTQTEELRIEFVLVSEYLSPWPL